MKTSTEKQAAAIFAKILPEIKPTPSEIRETTAKVNLVMRSLGKIVPKNVELRVTGSISKGTNLKGGGDIDIFMLFSPKTKREKLEELGLQYGKKLASKSKKDHYEIKYAEHPYVRVFLDSVGIKADIVPALKIDDIEDMGTAVDRTPLHTSFINDHLTAKQRDEVRLLKYLLKVHGIYGAEAKVGGFPGYLCEILVYQFGTLFKLLEAAALFKNPIILNPDTKAYSNNADVAKQFGTQFVVIDPVDSKRNVAAGVSPESFGKFVLLARQLVKKPSAEAFKESRAANPSASLAAMLKQNNLQSFLITTSAPDKSEEILWPQLRKSADILADYVARFGFTVYFKVSWIEEGEGAILLVAPPQTLTSRLFKGPEVIQANASDSFMKSHKGASGFVVNGVWLYVLDKNRHPTIGDAIAAALKENALERGKDISFRNAKLFVNKIPSKYAANAHAGLYAKLHV